MYGGEDGALESEVDYHKYMNELMLDLHNLQQLAEREHHFTHLNKLLINEIERVWSMFYCNNPSNSLQILPNSLIRQEAGRLPQLVNSAVVQTAEGGDQYEMKEKIYIPKTPENSNCNLIGRLIGPCGISIKQLEAETNCSIRIRGEGSVKDPRREKQLKSFESWKHLHEPLHVLITARDSNMMTCENKLKMATNFVKTLLTPIHDEYKKKQLIQLAIINGTYRHRNCPSSMNENA
ncbi:unnamed protein product [Auanema sp. JU1783]|nr:unnamed protein product [Auanema sp. JU1783]